MSLGVRSTDTRLSKRITKPIIPTWAATISELRQHLRMTQASLAQHLRCSPMAVSRWESGHHAPPSHVYIELGNLAGDPDCWYFWARAGLRSEDLMRVLPKLVSRMNQQNQRG